MPVTLPNAMQNARQYDKSYYSQWERKQNTATPAQPVPQPGDNTRATSKTPTVTLSVGRRPYTSLNSRTGKDRLNRPPKSGKNNENIRLLEMKIQSCRSAIANFESREQGLIHDNIKMKELIQKEEQPEHDAVKKLLRRYEKFRGGMSFLCENFNTTIKSEQDTLKQLELKLQSQLNSLQQQVDELNAELEEQQNQVHILNNYKDKEYPVKAIRIAELLGELDQIEMDNEDELDDLERVIDSELRKLVEEGNKEEMTLKESALASVLSQMHPSLKQMAEQNQVMERELEYHKQQITQLEKDIESLKKQVKHLLLHPKTNVRLQMFPELFKYETKCTPDMDVILDIPKIDMLPI